MTPCGRNPSISGEVCYSIPSGLWVMGAVSEQTPPVMWTSSGRTVGSIGREQRYVSGGVGCEHASPQIQSRNNVENLGHFYRYTFLPKLSFQAPYSWFFPRRISLNLTSYFSWTEIFFLLLLRSAQEAAVRSSSVMNIYKGQYTGSRALWWQRARQLHWAFTDESLLLMVSYQLVSASAVLQMPFFPDADFALEFKETAIPQPRCVAFLRPVWLPLGRSRLAGAQEIWVLGEP